MHRNTTGSVSRELFKKCFVKDRGHSGGQKAPFDSPLWLFRYAKKKLNDTVFVYMHTKLPPFPLPFS